MTLDQIIGLSTLVAAMTGLYYARVAAKAGTASLKELEEQKAEEVLSDIEKLLLVLAAARHSRSFLVPDGGLSAFPGVSLAVFPPKSFIPIGPKVIDRLIHLGLIQENGTEGWTNPDEPNTLYNPRSVRLTNKGFLNAQALNLDVQMLLEKHRVHSKE